MDYQDVLAELGASSAHPGGHHCTMQWTKAVPWSADMRVLDVGCGTGRTILHLHEQYGCRIYGVDVRKKMIAKAKKRAALRGIPGVWKVGSAERLPFASSQFDVVYTESVNVFVNPTLALKEYERVLKPGGYYADVEMMVLSPVTAAWRESVLDVYGANVVPDLRGWKRLYTNAGFDDVHVLMTEPVRPMEMATTDQTYPDEIDLATPGAYQNSRVLDVLRKNSEWLEKHHQALGYGVFVMRKNVEVDRMKEGGVP